MSLVRFNSSSDGTNLSISDWTAFTLSKEWKAILFDLDERRESLIESFKEGEEGWSADFIRGKLTEIDFFRQLPILIGSDIMALQKRQQLTKEVTQDES